MPVQPAGKLAILGHRFLDLAKSAELRLRGTVLAKGFIKPADRRLPLAVECAASILQLRGRALRLFNAAIEFSDMLFMLALDLLIRRVKCFQFSLEPFLTLFKRLDGAPGMIQVGLF